MLVSSQENPHMRLYTSTTPNGRNWIHKRYVAAQDRSNWSRWQCPSSDNPLNTAEELADIKLEIGPRRFAQEHEARFTDVKGAMWPSSYFGDEIWADRWPDKFEMAAIALDPSMGKTEQSDYQAAVFVGLTSGMLWVDSMMVRLSPGELVEDVTEFWRVHGSPMIGCETNGFQALYQNLFDNHCEKHGMMPMPFYGINNSENKTVRIQRIDPHLASSKLRFRDTPSNQLLVEQLMMFPLKSWHDDGPDALEMALRLLTLGKPVIEYQDEMIEI